jgi:hypothetical protein
MIFENIEIDISKKIVLQMIVKTINNIAYFDELMSTLQVFDAYSRIHAMNSSIFFIT